MTGSDDTRAEYLANGNGGGSDDREQLDLIRGVLANPATWGEPPEGVIDGVVAAVAVERSASAAAGSRTGLRALAAVGIVAAIGLLVVGVGWLLADPTPDTVVAISGTDLMPEASGVATLRPTGSGWYIRLDVDGLPPAPEGTYYEGWVWSEDEGVSIGTFHMRGEPGPVVLWAGVDLAEYPSIWVTLEDEGAGPEASDQVLMKGNAGESAGA